MSLTEISVLVHKYMPAVIVGFLTVCIFYFGIQLLIIAAPKRAPGAVPTPTPAFGVLLPPVIESIATPGAKLTFTLDTLEGVPVTATNEAKIYFKPEATKSFGFVEKANGLARSFGFAPEALNFKLQKDFAIYADASKRLSVDIANFNYSFSEDINSQITTLLANKAPPPDADGLKNLTMNLLQKYGRNPPTLINSGYQNNTFLHYASESSQLVQTNDPASTDLIQIDLFPASVESIPIVAPHFFTSANYFTIINTNLDPYIVKAQLSYFDYSLDQTGIYPLITGQQAYDDLISGKWGYVAGNPSPSTPVRITKMYLAYLAEEQYSPYMQPVYVFQGDNSFVAYVPAVVPQLLGTTTPTAGK